MYNYKDHLSIRPFRGDFVVFEIKLKPPIVFGCKWTYKQGRILKIDRGVFSSRTLSN